MIVRHLPRLVSDGIVSVIDALCRRVFSLPLEANLMIRSIQTFRKHETGIGLVGRELGTFNPCVVNQRVVVIQQGGK